MTARSYYMVIYLTSGLLSVFIFTLLFVLVYRWKYKKSFQCQKYPAIVLTSHDSPQLKEKKLWSPVNTDSPQVRHGRKSISKTERSEKVRSYWFPKRDIIPFIPPTKGEYQQPVIAKQSEDEQIKGRLKFSFSYDYNMELQKSVLTVRLHHGRDYTSGTDELPMDSFVKTRLLPSKRQAFTSKIQRRSLNPNYNEYYQFDIEYPELNSQVLCFEVFRYLCLSKYEIFGEVIVPFKDMGFSGCSVIKEVLMSMNIVENTGQGTWLGATSLSLNNNVTLGGTPSEEMDEAEKDTEESDEELKILK